MTILQSNYGLAIVYYSDVCKSFIQDPPNADRLSLGIYTLSWGCRFRRSASIPKSSPLLNTTFFISSPAHVKDIRALGV
jgi:hypothetical protein